MTSEQQYYEAKVFLTAYNDALRTLEYKIQTYSEIATSRATIEKYKAYERYLLSGVNKAEVEMYSFRSILKETLFVQAHISTRVKSDSLGNSPKHCFPKICQTLIQFTTMEILRKNCRVIFDDQQ